MIKTEPTIQVGILAAQKISFELRGNYTLRKSEIMLSGIYTAYLKNDKIIIESENKIIDNKYFDFEDFCFFESNLKDAQFTLFDVVIGINFHWQKSENQSFKGDLKIIKENENIRAINILPIEEYLKSVISSEMNANASPDFLKAHAVISRSWLLAQIDKKNNINKNNENYNSIIKSEDEYIRWYDREDHTGFDVCADDHCQRYQGVGKVTNSQIETIIEETRGETLIFDNKICDARFAKACGGATENFENVWENVHYPYLSNRFDCNYNDNLNVPDLTDEKQAQTWIRSAPKSFCNTTDKNILSQVLTNFDNQTNDFYRWCVEYSQNELSTLIFERTQIDFGDIIDLVPIERGKSGRIIKLKIWGTKKTKTIGKELEIRRTLSQTHLYSSAFVVDKFFDNTDLPVKFSIKGAGWGHGVGLCQIGAAVMGAAGYSYENILEHYFGGAKIEKLYE